MESFFATLKKERVHQETYSTREEARASVFDYIELFYNRKRRHSALAYQSPDDFERTSSRGEEKNRQSGAKQIGASNEVETGAAAQRLNASPVRGLARRSPDQRNLT